MLEKQTEWAAAGVLSAFPVAYFSMEFGIEESIPIYSGGLGILAGDHLKSASDLGLPLVGIGLLYREGYFQQRFDASGRQHEDYVRCDPAALPLARVMDRKGMPLSITLLTRTAAIRVSVWELRVGQVRLFLLDTDREDNEPDVRALTARLYGGDERTRIRQEFLLGVGGLRALVAVKIRPSVIHLNEGHCAFACLERVRMHIEEEGCDAADATQRVRSHTVFTTHTPVAAGHDRFPMGLVEETLGPLRDSLRWSEHDLLATGSEPHGDRFCMTTLALRFAERVNGVSALHGHVSRQMWQKMWPHRERNRVPIGHITNGVHVGTWLAPKMRELFDQHFPADWRTRKRDPHAWSAIESVPPPELWRTHQELKEDLISDVRTRAAAEARRRGESMEIVKALEASLSRDVLLVGFARRFAPYKRASLILTDLDALDRLVNDEARPVHFVFAGKAHPRDEGGKALIQRVFEVTRDLRFRGKVILLEGHGIEVAKKLVAGVDVWLNNPRRPLEASGTSGQKVALNGGLNCSVLDGWWAEGYDGANGFAIGDGAVHVDHDVQDKNDAVALQRVLTEEVISLYYDRAGGLSPGWIARMKRTIRTLGWRFNSDRMVLDYAERYYLPAAGGELADTYRR